VNLFRELFPFARCFLSLSLCNTTHSESSFPLLVVFSLSLSLSLQHNAFRELFPFARCFNIFVCKHGARSPFSLSLCTTRYGTGASTVLSLPQLTSIGSFYGYALGVTSFTCSALTEVNVRGLASPLCHARARARVVSRFLSGGWGPLGNPFCSTQTHARRMHTHTHTHTHTHIHTHTGTVLLELHAQPQKPSLPLAHHDGRRDGLLQFQHPFQPLPTRAAVEWIQQLSSANPASSTPRAGQFN
jgi:hypothetical protein